MTDTGRTYRNECTGLALDTVRRHSEESNITLFAASFCPFVQRVWVALECLDIPYTISGLLPAELLELSPKGLVPALRLNNFDPPKALNESTVILQYLEDLAPSKTLLPPISKPYARALVYLQSDHINKIIVPAFYRFLQAQDADAQITSGQQLHGAIDDLLILLQRMEHEAEGSTAGFGVWFEGNQIMNLCDVMIAPWLFRATNVLKRYRAFEFDPSNDKLQAYLRRLFANVDFKKTCSTEDLYLDSYERYAYNRPNTSQVANAINEGRSLP